MSARYRSIVLALAAAALAGCSPTEPETVATFRGTWAGQAWEGTASASLGHDGTVYLAGVQPPGATQLAPGPMPATMVGIDIAAFDGAGTYSLGAGNARFYYLLGGDVVTATYSIDPDEPGTLVITQATDTSVSGTVDFAAVTTREDPPAGARARFVGSFEAVFWVAPPD